ncbi:MAG: hypothetical protein B7Z66_01850 [Chromatiales bacterium 21-64-14]|nr:MAG: hypothetical protein B7Z66_01850 [Chromatiales bacterium 21-64-14]HQU14958.1 hypothetical protein [Gammaproteobacteria bacterium]
MAETTQSSLFLTERALPREPGDGNVVQWHAFRRREDAERFGPAVRLGPGQRLVGGHTRDSVGPLWWVGVQVDDLSRWGNRQAINKRAG